MWSSPWRDTDPTQQNLRLPGTPTVLGACIPPARTSESPLWLQPCPARLVAQGAGQAWRGSRSRGPGNTETWKSNFRFSLGPNHPIFWGEKKKSVLVQFPQKCPHLRRIPADFPWGTVTPQPAPTTDCPGLPVAFTKLLLGESPPKAFPLLCQEPGSHLDRPGHRGQFGPPAAQPPHIILSSGLHKLAWWLPPC